MLFFISLILLGQFIRVNMDTFCCNYRILEVVGQEIIQFTSQHQGNLTQSEFTVLCLAKIKNNSSYNTWFCILSATPNFLLLTVTRLQISLCHCHHHRHFTVIKLTQWEMPSTFFFFFLNHGKRFSSFVWSGEYRIYSVKVYWNCICHLGVSDSVVLSEKVV